MATKLHRPPSRASEFTVQNRIVGLRKDISGKLLEREDEIDLTFTAIVASTTLFLAGPVGAAKSFTLESILSHIDGATYFPYLLNKFTEPDEIFGPIDVPAMLKSKRRRLVDGYLPTAHFAFLDEYFKASTAIANTLLRIVNERKYNNGDGDVKVPLIAMVTAGNEYPQGDELAASFDRLVLRKNVRYVQAKSSRQKLRRSVDHTPHSENRLTLSEIQLAIKEAANLEIFDDVHAKLDKIDEELERIKIRPSDRRWPLTGKILRAYAYIKGSRTVLPEHLEVLAHMLWMEPIEEPMKVFRIVSKIANPLALELNDHITNANTIVANTDLSATEADKKLKGIAKELEKLTMGAVVADPRVQRAREHLEACIKTVYERVLPIS